MKNYKIFFTVLLKTVTKGFPLNSKRLVQNVAFGISSSSTSSSSLHASAAATNINEIPTKPIEGMRPGTSGLRKKSFVWSDPETPYVENFIQSLLNTLKKNKASLDTIIVAGDGRYYNNEAMQRIFRVLAGNGVVNIWVPQGGIMSTPAVSAAIRERENGKAQGAIVLTASHNPGGPDEDFGIKYNEEYGQPAGEELTEALYKESLEISSFYQTSSTNNAETIIDINAAIGTTFSIGSSTTVTIIDPFKEYIETLEKSFDFSALKKFCRGEFKLLFDGMHGAGGPFAKKVFCEMLGLPLSSLMRCDPRLDFGKCHPDPNLTYASELIKKVGLLPNGSPNPDSEQVIDEALPTLGAANDGDGDRNLICGAQCFVTPSDSLAIICDNWEAIPQFKNQNGLKGVARSMPSSAALDVVAKQQNIPLFVTPTGWKFFGNLMSSKEMFDTEESYTPFLCGEESFGTGSDHIREKDGLWAVLAWMSILMNTSQNEGKLVSVQEIVQRHWGKYGRHFYCRYDYEAVESDSANQVMDLIRNEYLKIDTSKDMELPQCSTTGTKLVNAVEFSYKDPVDGSETYNQGLILNFETKNKEPARVVFRLSGTGSAGATIRMYVERFEQDVTKHEQAAPIALKGLADFALQLVQMEQLTGRAEPTVIT